MNIRQVIAVLVCLAMLGACAKKEEKLLGTRVDVRVPLSETADMISEPTGETTGSYVERQQQNIARPIQLPSEQENASWRQVNGNATHSISHPSIRQNISLVWTASIGQGNSRRNRISASPVVDSGVVFALDSVSTATAHSVSGELLWSISLVPPLEDPDEASNGGLALNDSTLFASTGYGMLYALDRNTGEIFWQQEFEAPALFPPTVIGNRVYIVTSDSKAWAIDSQNGRLRWSLESSSAPALVATDASPAGSSGQVVLPFPSGELIAADSEFGTRNWSVHIGGASEAAPRSTLRGISGAPVIYDGKLYATNQAGKMSAIETFSGSTLWTTREGSYSAVWPAGDSVFVVTDQAQLARLEADSGERIWSVDLPFYKNSQSKRRKAVYSNFGPLLAGGRLFVASSDGFIREFDPESGILIHQTEIPGGAASGPVVAGRTLYIVSTKGVLHAFQ